MAYIGPTSLDLLTTSGVLDTDANAFITGTPSNYLQQCNIRTPGNPQLAKGVQLPRQPLYDAYNPNKILKKDNEPCRFIKKIATGALGLYVLGFICSKGKKNPIEGLKGIGNVLKWCGKAVCKIFKSEPKKP